MSGTVFLTAANGRTGRAVLQVLAARGARVRAFVRRAEQGDELLRLGAWDVAIGDLADPSRVAAALGGCERVVHIGPPMHADEPTLAGNVLDAAQRAAVQRFVYYSVLHPLRREVRHHRLKLEAEQMIVESGAPYVILQPGRYMQHLESIWREVTEAGVHAMPFSIDRPISVVDLTDLADAVATTALGAGHDFATYELAGPEALNQRQMAEVLSAKLGRSVVAQAAPMEVVAAKARASGASEDRVDQMRIMNAHYDRHGMRGNCNVLRWLLQREPTTYDAYVDRLLRSQAAVGSEPAKPQPQDAC